MRGGVQTVKLGGPFKGLNNIDDPIDMGPDSFVVADNIVIKPNGGLESREGYYPFREGSYTSIFPTSDGNHLYGVNGSSLVEILESATEVALEELVDPDGVMRYVELNDDVYYYNGTDSGIIHPDGSVSDWNWIRPTTPSVAREPGTGKAIEGPFQVIVTHTLPDGRETGTSLAFLGSAQDLDTIQISGLIPTHAVEAINVYVKPPKSTVFQHLISTTLDAVEWSGDANELNGELMVEFANPLPPSVECLTVHNGRIALMEYDPYSDATVVWFTEPQIYHLFRTEDYLTMKGQPRAIKGHPQGLFFSTSKGSWIYDDKAEVPSLVKLPCSGLVPGDPVCEDDDGNLFIWTEKEQLCTVFPFARLTDKSISVPPGARVSLSLWKGKGSKRIVALLEAGGSADNSWRA